jgi:hypothetical protein
MDGAGLIGKLLVKILQRTGDGWHYLRCKIFDERKRAMMKTLEFMGEAIRSPKHPFRKTENQPKKARKNRYERRKIKEYLHMTDLLSKEMA